jgi:hypothetical protein
VLVKLVDIGNLVIVKLVIVKLVTIENLDILKKVAEEVQI